MITILKLFSTAILFCVLIVSCRPDNIIDIKNELNNEIGNWKLIGLKNADTTFFTSDSIANLKPNLILRIDSQSALFAEPQVSANPTCHHEILIKFDKLKDTLNISISNQNYNIYYYRDTVSVKLLINNNYTTYFLTKYSGDYPPLTWPKDICKEQ
jgi:hypothetical protein